LPYRKLQHPTYVKDIDLDAHIKVFKKAIKANGEKMEIGIVNLVLLSRIVSLNGRKLCSRPFEIHF